MISTKPYNRRSPGTMDHIDAVPDPTESMAWQAENGQESTSFLDLLDIVL